VLFQLPHEVVDMVPLTDYPHDFKARERLAVIETKKFVRAELAHMAKEAHDKKAAHDSDDYCSDESGRESESDDSHYQIISTVQTQSDPARPYLAFIDALPDCVALNLGFHAIKTFNKADHWCYCPCSKKLDRWRTRFVNTQLVNPRRMEDDEYCQGRKKFAPHALLTHLATMGGLEHQITNFYLRTLYKTMEHKALYDPNSADFDRAEAAETRKFYGYVLYCMIA
jgi:hypothetical protein